MTALSVVHGPAAFRQVRLHLPSVGLCQTDVQAWHCCPLHCYVPDVGGVWIKATTCAPARTDLQAQRSLGAASFSRCLQAIEALRRAKFKFAGRQKIIESRNWGFTHFKREDYVAWKAQGRIVNCGVHAEVPFICSACFAVI